jgi:hypothetical protein
MHYTKSDPQQILRKKLQPGKIITMTTSRFFIWLFTDKGITFISVQHPTASMIFAPFLEKPANVP